jgi:hypothetical protein
MLFTVLESDVVNITGSAGVYLQRKWTTTLNQFAESTNGSELHALGVQAT